MSSNYNNNYNHLKRCYELYLKKLECNEMNKLDFTNYCKIPTIDIISKHLSWNENDYQEGILILIFFVPFFLLYIYNI